MAACNTCHRWSMLTLVGKIVTDRISSKGCIERALSIVVGKSSAREQQKHGTSTRRELKALHALDNVGEHDENARLQPAFALGLLTRRICSIVHKSVGAHPLETLYQLW